MTPGGRHSEKFIHDFEGFAKSEEVTKLNKTG